MKNIVKYGTALVTMLGIAQVSAANQLATTMWTIATGGNSAVTDAMATPFGDYIYFGLAMVIVWVILSVIGGALYWAKR